MAELQVRNLKTNLVHRNDDIDVFYITFEYDGEEQLTLNVSNEDKEIISDYIIDRSGNKFHMSIQLAPSFMANKNYTIKLTSTKGEFSYTNVIDEVKSMIDIKKFTITPSQDEKYLHIDFEADSPLTNFTLAIVNVLDMTIFKPQVTETGFKFQEDIPIGSIAERGETLTYKFMDESINWDLTRFNKEISFDPLNGERKLKVYQFDCNFYSLPGSEDNSKTFIYHSRANFNFNVELYNSKNELLTSAFQASGGLCTNSELLTNLEHEITDDYYLHFYAIDDPDYESTDPIVLHKSGKIKPLIVMNKLVVESEGDDNYLVCEGKAEEPCESYMFSDETGNVEVIVTDDYNKQSFSVKKPGKFKFRNKLKEEFKNPTKLNLSLSNNSMMIGDVNYIIPHEEPEMSETETTPIEESNDFPIKNFVSEVLTTTESTQYVFFAAFDLDDQEVKDLFLDANSNNINFLNGIVISKINGHFLLCTQIAKDRIADNTYTVRIHNDKGKEFTKRIDFTDVRPIFDIKKFTITPKEDNENLHIEAEIDSPLMPYAPLVVGNGLGVDISETEKTNTGYRFSTDVYIGTVAEYNASIALRLVDESNDQDIYRQSGIPGVTGYEPLDHEKRFKVFKSEDGFYSLPGNEYYKAVFVSTTYTNVECNLEVTNGEITKELSCVGGIYFNVDFIDPSDPKLKDEYTLKFTPTEEGYSDFEPITITRNKKVEPIIKVYHLAIEEEADGNYLVARGEVPIPSLAYVSNSDDGRADNVLVSDYTRPVFKLDKAGKFQFREKLKDQFKNVPRVYFSMTNPYEQTISEAYFNIPHEESEETEHTEETEKPKDKKMTLTSFVGSDAYTVKQGTDKYIISASGQVLEDNVKVELLVGTDTKLIKTLNSRDFDVLVPWDHPLEEESKYKLKFSTADGEQEIEFTSPKNMVYTINNKNAVQISKDKVRVDLNVSFEISGFVYVKIGTETLTSTSVEASTPLEISKEIPIDTFKNSQEISIEFLDNSTLASLFTVTEPLSYTQLNNGPVVENLSSNLFTIEPSENNESLLIITGKTTTDNVNISARSSKEFFTKTIATLGEFKIMERVSNTGVTSDYDVDAIADSGEPVTLNVFSEGPIPDFQFTKVEDEGNNVLKFEATFSAPISGHLALTKKGNSDPFYSSDYTEASNLLSISGTASVNELQPESSVLLTLSDPDTGYAYISTYYTINYTIKEDKPVAAKKTIEITNLYAKSYIMNNESHGESRYLVIAGASNEPELKFNFEDAQGNKTIPVDQNFDLDSSNSFNEIITNYDVNNKLTLYKDGFDKYTIDPEVLNDKVEDLEFSIKPKNDTTLTVKITGHLNIEGKLKLFTLDKSADLGEIVNDARTPKEVDITVEVPKSSFASAKSVSYELYDTKGKMITSYSNAVDFADKVQPEPQPTPGEDTHKPVVPEPQPKPTPGKDENEDNGNHEKPVVPPTPGKDPDTHETPVVPEPEKPGKDDNKKDPKEDKKEDKPKPQPDPSEDEEEFKPHEHPETGRYTLLFAGYERTFTSLEALKEFIDFYNKKVLKAIDYKEEVKD